MKWRRAGGDCVNGGKEVVNGAAEGKARADVPRPRGGRAGGRDSGPLLEGDQVRAAQRDGFRLQGLVRQIRVARIEHVVEADDRVLGPLQQHHAIQVPAQRVDGRGHLSRESSSTAIIFSQQMTRLRKRSLHTLV